MPSWLKYSSSDTQPQPQTGWENPDPDPDPDADADARLFCVFIQEPRAGGGFIYSLTPPPESDVRRRVGAKVALPYGGMLMIEFVLCLKAHH